MPIIGINGRTSIQATPRTPLQLPRVAQRPPRLPLRDPHAGASGKCSQPPPGSCGTEAPRAQAHFRLCPPRGPPPPLRPLSGPSAAKAALGRPSAHQSWRGLNLQRVQEELARAPSGPEVPKSESSGGGNSEWGRGGTSHGFGLYPPGRAHHPAGGTGRGQRMVSRMPRAFNLGPGGTAGLGAVRASP